MKNLISIITLIAILACGTICFASEGDYDPRVPKLILDDITSIFETSAGEYLELNLTLKNTSTNAAKNITVTPEIGELPITWEQATDYRTINTLRKNTTTTIHYKFKINSSAKIGTYGIKFNFNFYNIRNEVFTSSQTVYFKVTSEKSEPILTIGNVSTTPEVIAGEKFTLAFELKNIGDLDAKSLEIVLSSLDKNTFMPANSSDTQYLEILEGNSLDKVFFDLRASKSITKGTNEIDVSINYLTPDGTSKSTSKKIYINNVVSSNEASSNEGGAPKIIINSYYTNPKQITAGDTIDFGFSFMNTNSSKSIHNIKMTISSVEGAFTITKGSNAFYIESLGTKCSVEKAIQLNVKQDLTSKSYPIEITFNYEDADGNNYSSTEIISLPVTEFSKLVINSVYCDGGMLNNTTSMSFDFINMGKAKISNLTASVEGDFTANQSVNYIGNLEAGSTDYYDIEITPNKAGEVNGTLVLSFEDSSGKIIEERKDFSCFVMEEPVWNEPGEGDIIAPIEEVTPLNWWKIIGFGVAALIVSFILTKIIATKIIRKKLENEI